MIDSENTQIPIYRQCELLGLARSTYYYESQGADSYNRMLMGLIDEQFTRTPFYGVPRMTAWLNSQGQKVNHKRVRRLMRFMGLEAIYPKPRLSRSNQTHKKYPYLLNKMVIDYPDQVWCADITYIRMAHGFVYLVAIMDWYSRFVLAWDISTSINQPGYDLLPGGSGSSLGDLQTENFQYGSGQSVYQSRVYWPPGTTRHPHQHGWPRSSIRQYLCREAMAIR